MAGELVGTREFARRRGVSAAYISQMTSAGRIPKHDGLIDVDEANAVLDAVRAKADGRLLGGDGGGKHRLPAAAAAKPAPVASPGATAYTTARAVRETTLAKLEQLNYRQRLGELVEVEAVRRGLADAYAPVVREMRAMPDRIGGRMHAEPDERRARDLLTLEIERSLARIADIIAALPESIGKTRQ